jgi:hypothetical protein
LSKKKSGVKKTASKKRAGAEAPPPRVAPQKPKTAAAPDAEVRLLAVALHDVAFELLGNRDLKPGEEIDVQFVLSTHWLSPFEQLGVQLSLTVDAVDLARARVSYRAILAAANPGQKKNDERFWRIAAARIAPIVMYPYLRETFHTLMARSGKPSVLLPILNIGAAFDPDVIPMPAVS